MQPRIAPQEDGEEDYGTSERYKLRMCRVSKASAPGDRIGRQLSSLPHEAHLFTAQGLCASDDDRQGTRSHVFFVSAMQLLAMVA
jgi:hypothetical protein